MIGGKLMRLSLMLVKSLVFNFLREKVREIEEKTFVTVKGSSLVEELKKRMSREKI